MGRFRQHAPLVARAAPVSSRPTRSRDQGEAEGARAGRAGVLWPAWVQRCGIGSSCECPPRDQLAGVQRDLQAATAGGGAALPAGTRAAMESAFAADFSAVRVHTGPASDRVASGLGARALTAGRDIVFGAGGFRPHTPGGDRLLAHELAHVVQQAGGLPRAAVDGGTADPLEKAAEAAADQAATSGRVTGLGPAAPALERGRRAAGRGRALPARAGAYTRGTPSGDRVLAHKIAHVVQQSDGLVRTPIDAGRADPLERAADATADCLLARPGGLLGEVPAGAAGVDASGTSAVRASTSVTVQRNATDDLADPAPNTLRHKGRWGNIDQWGYLRLWAKEAAVNTLKADDRSVRWLQEVPDREPELVDGLLPKLVRRIHDEDEFEGSAAARTDAEHALRAAWPDDPLLKPEITQQLDTWYLGLAAAAVDRTPKGTHLEMRPEELTRIRNTPFDQITYTGRHNFNIERGQHYGNRTIQDVKGWPKGTRPNKDPTSTIWFFLDGHRTWTYFVHGSEDSFDWVVEEVAREVATSAQFAAMLFPLMLKIAGFGMGFSGSFAALLASEVLSSLGEEGLAEARGEKGRSGWEILKGGAFNVLVGHFAGRLLGAPGGKLAGEAEHVIERAAATARAEVAVADASHVATAIEGGAAREVDAAIRAKGYVMEVEIVSDGERHIWRKSSEGRWCRFSPEDHPLCVPSVRWSTARQRVGTSSWTSAKRESRRWPPTRSAGASCSTT